MQDLPIAMECRVASLCGFFIQSASLYTLLALTVDRYIFIKKPLHYPLIMTKCRTWSLLLTAFVMALLVTMLAGFAFDLQDRHLCTWTLNYPSWMQYFMILNFFLGMVIIINVYSVMFVKFTKSQTRLEALQKSNDEDYTRSTLTFHQTIGILRKQFPLEVPGLCTGHVETLGFKSLESGHKTIFIENSNKQRKKHSNSLVKSLSVLGSHMRAATYILVIVTTLLVTWTPFFLYSLYESITHDIAKKDMMLPDNDENMRILYNCLRIAVKNVECNMTIKDNNLHGIQEAVKRILHDEEADLISHIFGIELPLLHSLANPILYAFWYSDFRKHLVQIPHWWKQKRQPPANINFEMDKIRNIVC
eukprot:GFUD01094099.1.p1 GENE.GFUD01094099.1~~GFUD01094099.1.p1  ORF type:complete len:362 (+),score=25.64 GFUD01094099.1:575-1660(+)